MVKNHTGLPRRRKNNQKKTPQKQTKNPHTKPTKRHKPKKPTKKPHEQTHTLLKSDFEMLHGNVTISSLYSQGFLTSFLTVDS